MSKSFMYGLTFCLSLLVVVLSYGVYYWHNQSQKHQAAASILHDTMRIMVDNNPEENEEIYLDMLDNLDCHTDKVSKEDFQEYCWFY